MSDRSQLEMYQAFMAGYVKRINQATLNVTIGGIRIGAAKYTRLAQINLKTRIITFSRFAVENVPERGRRYLVLHELAHIKEANHTNCFWDLVGNFEPNFKQVGKELDLAFKRNVKEDQQRVSHIKLPNPLTGRMEEPKLLLSSRLMGAGNAWHRGGDNAIATVDPAELDEELLSLNDSYECMEDEFESWDNPTIGTIHGGSEIAQVAV